MKDNDAMWKLVREKDWAGVEQSISKGEWDPNRPLTFSIQEGGVLLLSAAAEHGLVSLAKQLIESGANVNARLRGEDTALMDACEMGHREVVDLLLQAGADVNKKSRISDEGDPGETPLMAAATQGYRDIVEKLLKRGADVMAKTRRGRSALTFVLFRGDIDRDLVRLLLEAGCPVGGRDLHHPIYQRDLDVVELLLAAKPDVNMRFDWPTRVLSNERGDTPLFVAVARNSAQMLGLEREIKPVERLAIVDLLLSAGADVNAQRGMKGNGWTPLMAAVAQDEDEIARRLMDAGADPNKTVECKRVSVVNGCQKRLKGPLSAVGMAQERPNNKKIRRFLLGHE
jgi:uncharacterized protein